MMSMLNYERQYWEEGYDFVIGIDEAGRGPLAGPVVAAATTVRNDQFSIFNFQTISNDSISNDQDIIKKLNLIRDSKKLSEKQREKLYDFICEHFHVGIGICDHRTIDRINILEATYLAMKKSLDELTRNMKYEAIGIASREESRYLSRYQPRDMRRIILVDGNKMIPNLSMEQRAIVGGDNIVKSISAASIIAKVTRDRIMQKMHDKYPQYCFDKHKGYGTKLHLDMLRKHGPCEIHRRSFKPVTKYEMNENTKK